MSSIPQDESLDSTLALLRDGYIFILKRCRRYQTDIFGTRLMLRKVICTMGEEATRMFYQPNRFTRRGAMPKTALWSLQDSGSVATLDEEAHHWRKQMHLSLMTPENLQRLREITAVHWQKAITKWAAMDDVVLFDGVQALLCRAACDWSGIPLTDAAARERTREFAAMLNGAGAVGPRNWWGLLLRQRTERWGRDIIEQVRAHKLEAAEDSAVYVIAWHRDRQGNLLDRDTAVVELLNVLRPIVGIARYIVFAALALHEHPACRQKAAADDDAYLTWFAQEVRRYYPFFPFVGGRVREAFEWRNVRFTQGQWVLLDLYGTNRDRRLWQKPDVFRPERFRSRDINPFNLIPQGGGSYEFNHRCAGEWLTVNLLKQAVHLMVGAMQYDVPAQDLSYSLSRIPAIPKSRVVIRQVRPFL